MRDLPAYFMCSTGLQKVINDYLNTGGSQHTLPPLKISFEIEHTAEYQSST